MMLLQLIAVKFVLLVPVAESLIPFSLSVFSAFLQAFLVWVRLLPSDQL